MQYFSSSSILQMTNSIICLWLKLWDSVHFRKYCYLMDMLSLAWKCCKRNLMKCILGFSQRWLFSMLPFLHSAFSPWWLFSTVPFLHCDFSPLWLYFTVPFLHCGFSPRCCKREEFLWSAFLPFLHSDTRPYLCCRPPSSSRAPQPILLKIQHPQKPFRPLCTISHQANSPVWRSQKFLLLMFYSSV